MSLKGYLSLQKSRLINLLMYGGVVPEADEYPCELCGGDGIIIKNVQISRCKNPNTSIENPNTNLPISFKEPMICPSCNGNGLNQKAFLDSVEKTEAA